MPSTAAYLFFLLCNLWSNVPIIVTGGVFFQTLLGQFYRNDALFCLNSLITSWHRSSLHRYYTYKINSSAVGQRVKTVGSTVKRFFTGTYIITRQAENI